MLTFGELFAGIGGFSLGLERAGMTCKWQVEIDPYATAVLNKHWPDVPKHDDVRTFPPTHDDYSVDLICGGFPCQDISVAGKGAGLAGERSGLWYEFARIIGQLRPRYVVVENVAALLTRGMDAVLGTLSTLGYDAEWHVIPAAAVGAPHRRERVWIVAYARCVDGAGRPCKQEPSDRQKTQRHEAADHIERRRALVADADSLPGPQQQRDEQWQRRTRVAAQGGVFAGGSEPNGWWESEPDVGRVAHGVPSRVDRLRCLGNAVVPQVVEVIGRAIVEHEKNRNASGMRP